MLSENTRLKGGIKIQKIRHTTLMLFTKYVRQKQVIMVTRQIKTKAGDSC